MASTAPTDTATSAVLEPLEGNKVKLTIHVPEVVFDKAIDAAFRKIAREVRIPGFRPGKAPRRLLESRLGPDVGRQQALQDSLGTYYAEAVVQNDVDVIAAPEIHITAGQDHGDVEFEAVVEVRPVVHLVGYQGLRVTIPNPSVDEGRVDEQIDALRTRFGELTDDDNPLVDGAFAQIDLTGSIDGEQVDALSASDYLYEVGSGTLLPELDEALYGAKTGAILSFEAELPDRFGERAGDQVAFRVLVKDTKRRVLPDADDDFAQQASEFDTIEELRADIRSRLDVMGKVNAQLTVREKVLEAVAQLVDVDLPEPLVGTEMQQRLEDMARRLAQQGITLEQYMAATGMTPEKLTTDLREAGEKAVRVDLALRAVVAQEGIEASDEEVDAEIVRLAERVNRKPAEVRRNLDRGGRLEAVRSDLAHGKAIAFLVEHAEVVDDEGVVLDLTIPTPADPADTTSEGDEDHEDTGSGESTEPTDDDGAES
jgi:trigger factor